MARSSSGAGGRHAIEFEEQRAKGIRRLDHVVHGAQLEGGDCNLLVPLDNEDGWDLWPTARNLLENREGIHLRMVVLDQDDVEGIRERGKRAVRFGDRLGNLDRPLRILQVLSGERRIADVEEPQRRLRRVRPCPRPLERASQDMRQVSQERLIVDDVVVCSRLELDERRPDVLRHDEHDWHGQPEAANVVHERGAALVLHLGFHDGRRDIAVVLDPTQGSGQGSGPCQLDVGGDTAKRLGSKLRGVALVGYIEDFHGSDDRDEEMSTSSIGRRSA